MNKRHPIYDHPDPLARATAIALDRAANQCQFCHRILAKNKQVGLFIETVNENTGNLDPDNLIVLCGRCVKRWPRQRQLLAEAHFPKHIPIPYGQQPLPSQS